MSDEETSEDDVVRVMVEFQATWFPRTCSCCGRRWENHASYLTGTTRCGPPHSYDIEVGVKNGTLPPSPSLGFVSFSNCECGTTLAMTDEGMAESTLRALNRWVLLQMQAEGLEQHEILMRLRERIVARVLRSAPAATL